MNELITIGWKTIVALIAGSSVLTTVGIWFLARFTSVFDAYSGERAKLLAQFHHIDRLVEQTERLASTTKTIEARISFDLWDRQKRWEYKRDVYARLLQALGRMKMAHMNEERHINLHRNSDLTDSKNQWIQAALDKAYEDSSDATAQFMKEKDAAAMVISDGLYGTLTEMIAKLVSIKESSIREDFASNIRLMERTFDEVLVTARDDLGFSVQRSNPASELSVRLKS